MVPSPPNIPASHPVGELHQRNLYSNLAATHPSPLIERKERDIPPRILTPELFREQYLLTNLLLQSPPSSKNTGNTRPGRANRIIATPNPSIFRRNRECPAAGKDDTSPLVDGTGSPIKGGSGRDDGPEVPHPHIN